MLEPSAESEAERIEAEARRLDALHARALLSELRWMLIGDIVLLALLLSLTALSMQQGVGDFAYRARTGEIIGRYDVIAGNANSARVAAIYVIVVGMVLACWGVYRSALGASRVSDRTVFKFYLVSFILMLAIYFLIFSLFMGWMNTGWEGPMRRK